MTKEHFLTRIFVYGVVVECNDSGNEESGTELGDEEEGSGKEDIGETVELEQDPDQVNSEGRLKWNGVKSKKKSTIPVQGRLSSCRS